MNSFLNSRAPDHASANPSQRILVVEDDDIVRTVSARTLLRFGYQVDTAEDGAAGWEDLQARNYDLLLTDHNMPRMTGIELVKKVRLARMTLPAVLASGALPMDELERHPWLKFAGVLAKPFSTEELLATVRVALNAPDNDHDHASISVPFPTAARRQFMPPRRWGINE